MIQKGATSGIPTGLHNYKSNCPIQRGARSALLRSIELAFAKINFELRNGDMPNSPVGIPLSIIAHNIYVLKIFNEKTWIFDIIMIMDRERKKRRQTIKLIITEIMMVVVVIVAVVILMFLAMGYNVNKNGDLAQSGLLQVKSIPSGATVKIDGETLIAKTNMSRMLAPGKHMLALSKDGYDTWSKEITTTSGWLLKLDYPRLFLRDRTMEKIREYDAEIEYSSFSNDGGKVLYKVKGAESWQLLNIAGDEVSDTKLDLSKYLGARTVREIIWNENNDKVLMRVKNGDKNEWILVNISNFSESINVTEEFGLDFAKVRFLTGAGDRLVALENGNLRIITINGKTISGVLASNASDFYNDGTTLIYIGGYIPKDYQKEKQFLLDVEGDDDLSDKIIKAVMIYQDSAEDIFVTGAKNGGDMKISLSEYLGKKYLAVTLNQQIFIHSGELPVAPFQGTSDMEEVVNETLNTVPENLTVWTDDELIMARNGGDITMFDAETAELSRYKVGSDNVFILSDFLLGAVEDGKLKVFDFDGQNRRELSKVSGRAVISRNHKWLYYTLVVDGKTNIFRERIVE